MSAFKYEGNIPIAGIRAMRLQDKEKIKNAFEISGPFIENILAICQSASEANKWVELLGKNSTGETSTKRNTGFTSGINLQPNVSNILNVYHFASRKFIFDI